MKRAQGFVIFTALIMLAALTMIGLALTRAVSTTNVVAANIGFLQSTMTSSDSGLEDATTWLQNNLASLTADNSAMGYYARDAELLAASRLIDYTGAATPGDTADDVNWDGAGAGPYTARLVTAADGSGNQIAYIIHRLCTELGSPGAGTNRCAKMSISSASSGSKSGVAYGSQNITGTSRVYYRITTRARGPRNTASYVQSTVVITYN